MAFRIEWQTSARRTFDELMAEARKAMGKRQGQDKSTKVQGLFKQVYKCIQLLSANPRHPGLRTHVYHSLENPYELNGKVFEAYAQNRTPGAYRIFWCYGPDKNQITILAITPHP